MFDLLNGNGCTKVRVDMAVVLVCLFVSLLVCLLDHSFVCVCISLFVDGLIEALIMHVVHCSFKCTIIG